MESGASWSAASKLANPFNVDEEAGGDGAAVCELVPFVLVQRSAEHSAHTYRTRASARRLALLDNGSRVDVHGRL